MCNRGRGGRGPDKYSTMHLKKKAIIYDLDNTIYPVPAIGQELFASLFALIEQSGAHSEQMAAIRDAVQRQPFQVVARRFGFSRELTERGLELLRGLSYEGEIRPFEDYEVVRRLAAERFLVTTGFMKMQWSKIRGMGLERDFLEIHVVDPEITEKTKRDVFADILQRHGYHPPEVLVVGDDPHSEIAAAMELGIDTVLYDREGRYPEGGGATHRIGDFGELEGIVGQW